jgi:hypothetical protein
MTANYELPSVVEKRVRFFDGQFLQDQDFVDEQKYHLDRERRHLRMLHVAGIADGLAVSASASEPNKVTVAPGTAIDSDGRQLALAEARTVDLPAGTFNDKQGVELYIFYQESAVDVQTTKGSSDFTRWLERPKLEAVAPGGAYAGATPPVLLARVALDSAGRVTVDDTVRAYSGLRLPGAAADAPTLRSTAGGQVALTGSLTVDGNLGVGTPPSARLSVAQSGATEITGTAQSAVVRVSAGALGTTAGSEVALSSTGLTVTDNMSLGVRAIRTAAGSDWRTTALGLGMDVGDTVRAGASLFLHANGNVGIGTSTPGAKLVVSGGALFGGALSMDGTQKIQFNDQDTSNNLKLQLWSGYGLGINSGTMFYAAREKHSWRDQHGANERMELWTAADGGLNVKGTGASSFAGSLGVGAAPSARLSVMQKDATAITGSAQSAVVRVSAGALGTTADSEVALSSTGLTVTNNMSLGVRAIRTAAGSDWRTTALGLGMDVDNTVRAGAALFLHANRNVGIGTTTPPERLSVAGDMQVGRVKLLAEKRTGEDGAFSTVSCSGRLHITGDEILWLLNKNGVIVSKNWGGNGNLTVEGTLTQSSDARLKERIRRLECPLDRLTGVRGVSYLPRQVGGRADRSEERPAIGVLAQEVEAVFPQLVSTPGGDGYKAVDYNGLTAVLLEAVKELKTTLDALRERVDALQEHA